MANKKNMINNMTLLEMKENVQTGNMSPFEALIILREYKEQLDECRDVCIKSAISIFDRNSDDGGKTVARNGFVFRQIQTTRYDYKNNPNWVQLLQNIKVLEKKMQLASNAKSEYIDTETGEIVPPAVKNFSEKSIRIEQ